MTQRPNIIFVFCDQLRQAAVGCYRQDPVLTPNLDRFAADAKVLTHCVSTQPVCTPYRGMLFTGQYSMRNGLYSNCNSTRSAHLNDSFCCFSDVFSRNGYACGYIGKLHLHKPQPEHYHFGEGPRSDGSVWDAFTPPGPARHGFDFWYSYGCDDNHMNPHYWTGNTGPEVRIDPHEWSVKHETDIAIDYLRNPGGCHRDPHKPFLLVMSHNPPHPPFAQVPPEYVKPFIDQPVTQLLNRPSARYDSPETAQRNAARYFGAVHGIDQQFQRLLDTLDALNLADDTIVIFTSDHGEMLYSHGCMQKNIWYDESLLVPWLIRWPHRIRPGVDDMLLGTVDIYPTLLGLAGLTDAAPDDLDGNDRSGLFLGHDGPRPTSALYLWPGWTHYGTRPFRSARGLRTHRHMFVVGKTQTGEEDCILHDCMTDPYQQRNVAAAEPALVASLRDELTDWLQRSDDPWSRGEIEPNV